MCGCHALADPFLATSTTNPTIQLALVVGGSRGHSREPCRLRHLSMFDAECIWLPGMLQIPSLWHLFPSLCSAHCP
jgi:hypothetical protein